jgi:hypothetical protein
MSEENAIRVLDDQPEAAAIEIPHKAGHDRGRNVLELCLTRSLRSRERHKLQDSEPRRFS